VVNHAPTCRWHDGPGVHACTCGLVIPPHDPEDLGCPHCGVRCDVCVALIAEVERLREEVSLSVELREKVEAGLTAELERLHGAIVRHRHNVWGDDAVTHDDDRRLYAALSPDTKEDE